MSTNLEKLDSAAKLMQSGELLSGIINPSAANNMKLVSSFYKLSVINLIFGKFCGEKCINFTIPCIGKCMGDCRKLHPEQANKLNKLIKVVCGDGDFIQIGLINGIIDVEIMRGNNICEDYDEFATADLVRENIKKVINDYTAAFVIPTIYYCKPAAPEIKQSTSTTPAVQENGRKRTSGLANLSEAQGKRRKNSYSLLREYSDDKSEFMFNLMKSTYSSLNIHLYVTFQDKLEHVFDFRRGKTGKGNNRIRRVIDTIIVAIKLYCIVFNVTEIRSMRGMRPIIELLLPAMRMFHRDISNGIGPLPVELTGNDRRIAINMLKENENMIDFILPLN